MASTERPPLSQASSCRVRKKAGDCSGSLMSTLKSPETGCRDWGAPALTAVPNALKSIHDDQLSGLPASLVPTATTWRRQVEYGASELRTSASGAMRSRGPLGPWTQFLASYSG